MFLKFAANHRLEHQFFIHQFKDNYTLWHLVLTGGSVLHYVFKVCLQVIKFLIFDVPGLVNLDTRDSTLSEEFQHCSWSRRLHFPLEVLPSFWIGCRRWIVNFKMFHAYVALKGIEYLQGFLWILHGNLFKGGFGILEFVSVVSISLITFVKTRMISIWMIFRIQETVQNGNIWNSKFNDVSLLRDFLMQYNVIGFMCPFYACFNALEPEFVFCSQFFFFHC